MSDVFTGNKPASLNLLKIEYASDSVVSKSVYRGESGNITLFAFDQGQKLSKHTAPFDAFIQVLEGSFWLKVGENEFTTFPGDMVFMPANVPHELSAKKPSRMILFMFKN